MKKNPTIFCAPSARGFTLVELMIALLIGIIISIGVVQIFGASRATYQLDEALARTQESGRFALEFLSQDIRHAGYIGCRRDDATTPLDDPVNFLANGPDQIAMASVRAFEFNGTGIGGTYTTPPSPANTFTGWTPALTSTDAPTGALPGTDVIAVQRMVPNNWRLVPPFITLTTVHLAPASANAVNANDVLMVSDCRQAAVFMVTNITAGVITHTASPTTNRCDAWQNNLGAGASCTSQFDNPEANITIGAFETVVFYVANDNTSGRPTLYRNVINPTGGNSPQALVEGVENFQVLYGVDDVPPFTGTPDRYVPASGVSDFGLVVSVQIGILVYGVNATGSANDTGVDVEPQVVAGTSIAPPNDKRKRRVFNTTIQLRNRGS